MRTAFLILGTVATMSCASGTTGQTGHGDRSEVGHEAPPEEEATADALARLYRGCEQGIAEDCAEIGIPLAGTSGSSREQELASLEGDCAANDMSACRQLLQAVRSKALVKDRNWLPPTTALVLDHDCEGGNSTLCVELGWSLLAHNPPDYSGTLKIMSQACNAEVKVACEARDGLKRGRADDFYELACRQNDESACRDLAVIRVIGQWDRNEEWAAPILEKACEPPSRSNECGALGILYLTGKGVSRDERKGLELIKGACGIGREYFCGWIPDREAEEALAKLLESSRLGLKSGPTARGCRPYIPDGGIDRIDLPADPTGGDLAEATFILEKHPYLSVQYETQIRELSALRRKIHSTHQKACFDHFVVDVRKGQCARAARLTLKGLGLKAAVTTGGMHHEVLKLANIPCGARDLDLHRENLDFILSSCRFTRLECQGATRKALDFDWEPALPENFGELDPISDTSDGPPTRKQDVGKAFYLSPSEFCSHLAESYCRASKRCCTRHEVNHQDCVEANEMLCMTMSAHPSGVFPEIVARGNLDFVAGTASWDGEKAARIIKQFMKRSKTCDTTHGIPSPFDAMIGRVQAYDSCDYDRLQSCAEGLRCIARLNCIPPAKQGEACASDRECMSGSYCHFDQEKADSNNFVEDDGVCRQRKKLGERCFNSSLDEMCREGLVCSESSSNKGTCIRPRAAGQKCVSHRECKSNFCNKQKRCEPEEDLREELYCHS